MQIPELASELTGRIRQAYPMDHYEAIAHIEDADGEPLGEVVATAIRTEADDPYSVRARAYDRLLATVRAMGYEGQLTVHDEYGGRFYDRALGDPR